MAARKIDLMFGCLGNGVTVCNKAVMEHGDYKNVAHISVYGKITFYVPLDYLPEEEMSKIQTMADNEAKENKAKFEALPMYRQYATMLDNTRVWRKFCDDKRGVAEKLPEMREYFYEVY